MEELELREEWCGEILIALGNAVEREADLDAGFRMIVTMGYLLYLAPEAIVSLAQSLEFAGHVDKIMARLGENNTEFKGACEQVKSLLL